MTGLLARKKVLSARKLDTLLLKLLHVSEFDPEDPSWLSVDLEALFERAQVRRVAVIAASRLRRLPHVSSDMERKAVQVLDEAVLRDQALARATSRLAQALNEAGIGFNVHKGPALWRSLHAEYPFKVSVDIDVFLSENDLEQAKSILADQGYRCHDIHPFKARYFLDDDKSMSIDLHWGLLTVGSMSAKLQEFSSKAWQRQVCVDIEGVPVSTFSPTDMMLALALHAGCHHICKKWMLIYELALCTVAWADQIDWVYLINAADAAGLKDAISCPIRFASDRFGALVPDYAVQQLTLPVGKRGLDLIANATFDGRIRNKYALRYIRISWNLMLLPGPAALVAWAKQWVLHHTNKRRKMRSLSHK